MNRRIREFFSSWSRQDEDSRNAFLLIAGITVVVVIALAVAGYGFIKERSEDSDAVAIVGGNEIEYSYLEKRMSPFMRGDGSLSPEQFSSILSGILAELEQEKLLFHIARSEGITVSDEELDAEMREDLSVAADSTREVFATALRRELLTTGLGLGEYKNIQRAQVIETKLRDQLTKAVPAEAEQVNIRLLQVASQTQAIEAKNRLANGEQLGLVAGAMSTHSSSSKGGEVNWVVRGTFDSKLEDAMFSQAVGTISDIIETDDGFYIVEVRAKETRPVEESVRTAAVNRGYTDALEAARTKIGSEITMTNGQLNRLAARYSSSINLGG